MLFPSSIAALRCRNFLLQRPSAVPIAGAQEQDGKVETALTLDLLLPEPVTTGDHSKNGVVVASAVLFVEADRPLAAKFWQHTGEGISSRRAEFLLPFFMQGHLRVRQTACVEIQSRVPFAKGPKRYRKISPVEDQQQINEGCPQKSQLTIGVLQNDTLDDPHFIEERFGRNLSTILATNAKKAIRRRIAGAVIGGIDDVDTLKTSTPFSSTLQSEASAETDVFLFPTGMSSIFNTHRTVLNTLGYLKSVMFGWVNQ